MAHKTFEGLLRRREVGVAKWKLRREARGGECMLACFQGENCQGARDREEHRKRERGW